MALYGNVRTACRERGITVQALEKSLGYTRGSIYKWDEHIPSVKKVMEVAAFLNMDINDLLAERSETCQEQHVIPAQ